MSREDLNRWEAKYQQRIDSEWQPLPWVVAQAESLSPGLVLDLACGVGQHARWLASRGHSVLAIDGSYTALDSGRQRAHADGIASRILFVQADLDRFTLPARRFDLIVVTRFLLRPLMPTIERALRPGGHLLYATYTVKRCERRPDFNRAYLLASGELPHLFRSLTTVTYEEAGEWARLHARRPART